MLFQKMMDRYGALIVPKEKLAENGEYNLTGERYRVVERRGKQKWPMVRLGDVCEIIAGQSPDSKYYNENGIGTPFYQGKTEFTKKHIGDPVKWTIQETKIAEKDDILMSVRAPVGPINISITRICIGRGLAAIRPSPKILLCYLFEILKLQEKNIKGNGGAVFDSISKKDIESITIPLPPLEVQRETITEIEEYQKVIDGARQVVDNWKPRIEVDPEWPVVKLGEIFKLTSGRFLPQKNQIPGDYFVYGGNGVSGKHNEYFLEHSTLIIGRVGEYCGAVHITEPQSWVTDNALLANEYFLDVDQIYLSSALKELELNKYAKRGGQPSISQSTICELSIPFPSIEIQQEIAAKIEAERKIVDGCRNLIVQYKEKIKKVVDGVWGE
jgi:restriction endonuclease S subunit